MWLSYSLWLGTLAGQSWLLVHLLRIRLAVRYPCFFAYLVVSWASSSFLWVAHHRGSPYYSWLYWLAEPATVLAGFLLVWEVFRETLRPFPAIRRTTSVFGLILVLLLLAGSLLIQEFGASAQGWVELFYQTPRWLRLVQAVLLASLVGAARYYSLPLGRNVAGVALGFGLYVSLTVVSLASQALANIDLIRWGQLYAGTYLLTLVIWSYALRVYAPNPAPPHRAHLEEDYARLNAIVAGALLQLRGSWRRATGT